VKSTQEPAWPDGLPVPRRYWAIVAIWLAIFMSILDMTVVNVALPTMANELRTTPAASVWIVSSYQIAVTIVLLPLASLSERVGASRVYLMGLVLFVAASLLCATSTRLDVLVVGRFCQGLGGGAIQAMNGVLLRFTFPKERLGRGIGYNTFVVAITSASGPSIAAAILSVASWQWLFAINIPIGIVSFVIAYRSLPEIPIQARKIDLISILLNVGAFGAIFLVANDFAQHTLSLATWIDATIALSTSVALIKRSTRQSAPLVPVDLFQVRLLRLSYITASCSWAAQTIAMVSLPFYFARKFGLDYVAIGLLITPWPVGVGLIAPIAGFLIERVRAEIVSGVGLFMMGLGLSLLTVQPNNGWQYLVAIDMAMCGIGFGLFQTPNNRTLLLAAPPNRSGAAAGMLAVARLVGQTTGGVLVALLFRLFGPASQAALFAAAAFSVAAIFVSARRFLVERPDSATPPN
jgi:DHA2 family multidrug resistance protein-like MFS transporter